MSTYKSKMKKSTIRTIIIVAVAVTMAVIALRLVFYRQSMVYGFALLGLGLIAFLVWKAFIKNGRDELRRSEKKGEALENEISALRKQIDGLNRELDEKSRSRLNVVELSPILHLAVLNIDSSFVRTYVREDEQAGITFNGALRADICAEYGVKLEEVGFKYDPDLNLLQLSNFHPGLISYSKKRLNWEIARSYRTRNLFGLLEFPAITDTAADAFTKRQCEELRTSLEKEIDERKITEFEWLSPMISQQVTDMFKMIVGKPDLTIVALDSAPEEQNAVEAGFVDFPTFRRQLAGPAMDALPEE